MMAVQVYVFPTTDGDAEEEKKLFYSQVQSEINRTCKQDKLFYLGTRILKQRIAKNI